MTLILDGRKARDFYKTQLSARASVLKGAGIEPRLAIVQVGNNAESSIYIEQKKKFAVALGVVVDHVRLPDSVTQGDVAAKVAALNSDAKVHGVIIQLPIPAGLDKHELINMIDPGKDVDGLTDANQAALDAGAPNLVPATAKGVLALLDFYKIDVKGKKAAVFGRSRLVGHPTAELLRMRGADVTIFHSKSVYPQEVSRKADILVAAIGRPNHIGVDFVRESGVVVVDVGISSVGDADDERRVCGDVDFKAVSPRAAAISPVPGGVGPMTVLSLFDNLILAAERKLIKS